MSKIERLADEYRQAHRTALSAADNMMVVAYGTPEYDHAVNTWRSASEAEARAKQELINHAVKFGSR